MPFRLLQAIAAGLLLAACASKGEVAQIQPGEKPALDSDEAGLWMQVEKAEQKLRASGKVVTDPALNSYVKGIICKLEPEYCADIRLYIVKAAGFNASMAPNGAMHVWTGMLLRIENEAQLATVLAHELAHYRLRHSVQRWRDLRDKTDGLAFFQVATAMVGLAPVGLVGGFVALDSIYGFSREQEREADSDGFERLTRAGYDPRQAPRLWEMIVAEKEASDDSKDSAFFSTHPQSDEREETLQDKVKELGPLADNLELGVERYAAETARFRRAWLDQEIKFSDFGRSLVLIERLLERNIDAGDLHFAKGEVLRRRDQEGDLEKAVEAYKTAMSRDDYPVETHRSLGLSHWDLGRNAEAAAAFETYLTLNPDADDHLIIRSYVSQLK